MLRKTSRRKSGRKRNKGKLKTRYGHRERDKEVKGEEKEKVKGKIKLKKKADNNDGPCYNKYNGNKVLRRQIYRKGDKDNNGK